MLAAGDEGKRHEDDGNRPLTLFEGEPPGGQCVTPRPQADRNTTESPAPMAAEMRRELGKLSARQTQTLKLLLGIIGTSEASDKETDCH
ncbi:MAG TPA: hypothetical protein VNJ12_05825 [Candidatus Dormibacteraeota bacterium]|nr:hypothetical protein [Candidatus Dormibacteraeota bacterium]